MHISEFYQNGSIDGWVGEKVAKEQWNMLKGSPSFVELGLQATTDKRKMFLWEIFRKVMGKDMFVFTQSVGDCVSQGMRTAIEQVQCAEIFLNHETSSFRPIFPPYLYGCGRVFIGHNRISGDGSVGSWQVDAVIKYGALASDEPDCPEYSGSVARQWGSGKGPPTKFVSIGQQHLIKSGAKVKNWDDYANALSSGFAVTIASNQGFEMLARSDGFHAPKGNWGHQMCGIGCDETYTEDYGVLQNSWGTECHGHLKDFHSDMMYPGGVLRVRRKVIESMLAQGDSFAISNFDSFPDRSEQLQKALFKMA